MSKLLRILISPIGLIYKIIELSKDGSRDLLNKFLFKGVKIESGCCINSDTKIASNTHIFTNTIINNCKIASYTYIGKNCVLQNCEIGKFCSIANNVLMGLGNHPKNLFSTSPLFYLVNNIFGIQLVDKDYEFNEYENISIGNDVWIGTKAIILDGTKIGTGAIIAANSVVTKDIPPYAIAAGIPAKIINYRFEKVKIDKLISTKWWDWDLNEIKLRLHELYEY